MTGRDAGKRQGPMRWARRAAVLAALALGLGGCVYAPPPAAGYAYGPGYAYAPPPAYYYPYYYPAPVFGSLSFGFRGHFR
jgi:hypothetical protein